MRYLNPFTIYAVVAAMSAHSQTSPKIRARSSKSRARSSKSRGGSAQPHSLHGSLNKAIMITDKAGRQKLEKVKIALQKGYISAEK